MKFIFYIFPPNWESGGGMVVHEASRILASLGEEVYLTLTEFKLPENSAKVISLDEARTIAAQDDCVTIYPEVVPGNPLEAKHVLRWVLFYPGAHGMGDLTYHPSEYVFTFHENFLEKTPHAGAPVLRVFQSRVDKFFPMGKERTYDAVLMRKGKFNRNFQQIADKHFNPYLNIVNKKLIIIDDFIEKVSGFEQLNEIFNDIRYVFSFDNVSYYSVLAALSGCISVVAPIEGVSGDQWKKDINTHAYGVAYGFDDLHSVMQGQTILREYLIDLEQKNIGCIQNMMKLCKEKWNL